MAPILSKGRLGVANAHFKIFDVFGSSDSVYNSD